MATIAEVIDRFRREPDGPPDAGLVTRCSVGGPALPGEIDAAGVAVPDDVRALWSVCRRAHLYEDVDYGQWGLSVLDPRTSATLTRRERRGLRKEDLRPDDAVIGRFVGDLELLVVCPSETGARHVLVALPLDPRSEWYGVGADLAEFFAAYFVARGEKFWTRRAPQV